MQRLQRECVELHKDRKALVEKLTNIQNAQQVCNVGYCIIYYIFLSLILCL